MQPLPGKLLLSTGCPFVHALPRRNGKACWAAGVYGVSRRLHLRSRRDLPLGVPSRIHADKWLQRMRSTRAVWSRPCLPPFGGKPQLPCMRCGARRAAQLVRAVPRRPRRTWWPSRRLHGMRLGQVPTRCRGDRLPALLGRASHPFGGQHQLHNMPPRVDPHLALDVLGLSGRQVVDGRRRNVRPLPSWALQLRARWTL